MNHFCFWNKFLFFEDYKGQSTYILNWLGYVLQGFAFSVTDALLMLLFCFKNDFLFSCYIIILFTEHCFVIEKITKHCLIEEEACILLNV